MKTPRIAIVGGECSGKTSLVHALAAQFEAPFTHEYLREFVEHHQRPPLPHEQTAIARQQVKNEEDALEAFTHQHPERGLKKTPAFLFCDTAPIQTAAYSQRYFAEVPEGLMALVRSHVYDHYFLCAPDFAWQADAKQRSGEFDRTWVFEHLRKLFLELSLPYTELRGTVQARVAQASEILRAL